MPNSDTQAALRYHDGTKHPDGFLMSRYHTFDPMRQPLLFKIYWDLEPIPLPLDPSPRGMAALSAIKPAICYFGALAGWPRASAAQLWVHLYSKSAHKQLFLSLSQLWAIPGTIWIHF